MTRKSLSVLIYPILLVILLDVIFTLLGQPPQYWQSYSLVREGSPLGVSFLQASPFIFVLFMLAYTCLIVFLLKKLPRFWSLILGLTVYSGHLYGSGTWIYVLYLKSRLPDSPFAHWYLTIGYYIIISFISVLIVYKKISKADKIV